MLKKFIKRMQDAREAAAKELAENPEDSSSGKKFKQLYKLGDRLGRGAFSVVNEGTHKQSGKSYAIKIVNKYRLNKADAAALQIEIKILKEINHTHVVHLHDVFDDPSDDYVYMVTEKFAGGNLYDRIAKKGCYSDQEGRLACRNLFEAVAYTHTQSVVHRDLKLENLLLTSHDNDWDIKLIDFGFAKKVTSANGLHTFIGTPGYVAPCILEGVGYGTQADVWSLGVVLYVMLGGYPPFRDQNRDRLFNKIRKGTYEFHESKWMDVSSDAKDLISQLLTVDPSKRITAAEALQHRWITNGEEREAEEEEKEEAEEKHSMRSVSSLASIPELLEADDKLRQSSSIEVLGQ